jgi:serine protease AprX
LKYSLNYDWSHRNTDGSKNLGACNNKGTSDMNGNALVTLAGILGIAIATAVLCHDSPSSEPSVENSSTSITSARYIVQADSLEIARQAVEALGADITHELGIINAVGVTLSPEQFGELSKDSRLRIEEDRKAGVSSSAPSTFYPMLSGAADLHDQGITGHGVTVAVVDSGFWETDEVSEDTSGHQRVLAQYDAIAGTRLKPADGKQESTDEFGHGSHITSIILNSETDANGDFVSIAPDVRLVTVRAFDGDGAGTYLDVIRGLDWILNNRVTFNIRVVNLSFSAEPNSFYWDDPINQAVMRLWQENIVVVASAGNSGPDAMTIGVPGNVPYVITVGAMTDYGTPFYAEDDRLRANHWPHG